MLSHMPSVLPQELTWATFVIRENSFQVDSLRKSGGSQPIPNLAIICIHVLHSLFILLNLHLLEFLLFQTVIPPCEL